jgi:methylenetetrahydrofolate dehydrogenase (NADP+)/methenyltetrahydrofolate cyclohydrolase
MPAKIIDGKSLAAAIRADVARQIAELASQGRPVRLSAVLVGHNPAAKVYAENQAKMCAQVGIEYCLHELPAETTQRELLEVIAALNCDPAVTGIFLHTPLPGHLDVQRIQYAVDIVKDVEGVNPANIGHVFYGHTIIAPCTAVAVLEMIESTGVPIRGAEAVVVGASRIAGRPISLLLSARDATVTLCHIHTRDVKAHTRNADILVVAVGKAGLIGPEHVKPGAVVIDVGINRITSVDPATGEKLTRTVGDVQFDAVAALASHITPVPGGVGPMTVAMLLKNTLRAAKLVYGVEPSFGST